MTMTAQGMRVLPVILASVVTGCGWIQPRSGFERDPFVMSHLSKSSDESFAWDQPSRTRSLAMLTSRKPATKDAKDDFVAERPSDTSHAADFSWLVGKLVHREGTNGGWYVDYDDAGEADPYGGQLDLEKSPKLGLVRAGDRVLLEGEVVKKKSGNARYRVRSLALLD